MTSFACVCIPMSSSKDRAICMLLKAKFSLWGPVLYEINLCISLQKAAGNFCSHGKISCFSSTARWKTVKSKVRGSKNQIWITECKWYIISAKKELLLVESAEANKNWPSEINILMLLLMQPDLQGGEMKLYAFNINIFVQNSIESSLHLHRNHSLLKNKACLCVTASIRLRGEKVFKKPKQWKLSHLVSCASAPFCLWMLLWTLFFFWQGLLVSRFFGSYP